MREINPELEFARILPKDLPEIHKLETRAHNFPWSLANFQDCMKDGYEGWKATLAGDLVGHAILSMVVDECHLLTLSIAPEYQGQGLGRQLLNYVLARAKALQASHLFLEVRASNHIAYQLYYSVGFNEIGRRPGYYPGHLCREDALILAASLL